MNQNPEFDILKTTLQKVFAEFSRVIPTVTIEFLTSNEFNEDIAANHRYVGAALIKTGTGEIPLRVEQNEFDDFRISLLLEGESWTKCFHVMHITKESAGQIDNWFFDSRAMEGKYPVKEPRAVSERKRSSLFAKFADLNFSDGTRENIDGAVPYETSSRRGALVAAFFYNVIEDHIQNNIRWGIQQQFALEPSQPLKMVKPKGDRHSFT